MLRRSLMIPYFDRYSDHEERTNADDSMVGRVSSYFASLPVYISDIDLADEKIIISNPTRKSICLKNYQLVDDGDHHVFHLPNFSLNPKSSVTVYCTAGRLIEPDALPEPKLLWRNKDGTLRTQPVLNPKGDTVVIFDGTGSEVAAMAVQRRQSNLKRTGEKWDKKIYLPAYERSKMLVLRRARIFLCYLRLFLLVTAAMYAVPSPFTFFVVWFSSLLTDLFARAVHRASQEPPDVLDRALTTLGDRIENLAIYGTLILYYRESLHLHIGAMLMLELSSYWVEAHTTEETGTQSTDGVFLMATKHPLLISMVSWGHLAFMILLLLSNPEKQVFTSEGFLWVVEKLTSSPFVLNPLILCSAGKQLINLVQLLVSIAHISAKVIEGAAWDLVTENKVYFS